MIDHIKIRELISADYDGQATAEEKQVMEQHLKDCPQCRKYAEGFPKLSVTLQAWPNENLSPDLEQKIQGRLQRMKLKEGPTMKAKPRLVAVGGGGLIVAFLVLVVSMQMYAKRGIQGRLRNAADDIGTQFSPGTTTAMYEPYYLSTDYLADRTGARSAGESNVPQGTGVIESQIQAGTITAGDIEDNLNRNSYKKYVNEYLQSVSGQQLPFVATNDRITIRVKNHQGIPLKNTKIIISENGSQKRMFESFTHSDGLLYLFPTFDGITKTNISLTAITTSGESIAANIDLSDYSSNTPIEITLDEVAVDSNFQLDSMFVIDSTGSMGDELNYLKKEFTDIINRIKNEYPNVSIRYGLILYRDEGDEYVVRKFPFTSSVSTMQKQIEEQYASGGGDYEEAVHKAVQSAIEMEWNQDSTKMLFLVADAPPHNQFIEKTWEIAKEARKRGIHIYPVAASGVGDVAEYLMRSMSLITQGRYLFLTDDSGVGNTHQEPSIPCYVVTRLNDLMVRVISSVIKGSRIEPEEGRIIRRSGNYNEGICGEAPEQR